MTLKRIYRLAIIIILLIASLCLIQFRLIKNNYQTTITHYHNIIQKSGSDFLYPCITRSIARIDSLVSSTCKTIAPRLAALQQSPAYKIRYLDNSIVHQSMENRLPYDTATVFTSYPVTLAIVDSLSRKDLLKVYTAGLLKLLQNCYGKNESTAFAETMQLAFPSGNIGYRLEITYLSFFYNGTEYLLINTPKDAAYTLNASANSSGPVFDSLKSNMQGGYFHMQQRLSFIWPESAQFFISKNIWIIILSAVIILLLLFVCFKTIISMLQQKKLEDQQDDFINNITHEVKTPITTIDIASNSLMKAEIQQQPHEVTYLAHMISKQSHRLRYFFDQVLTLSVHHTSVNNIQDIDIHHLLRHNLAMIELNYKDLVSIDIFTQLNATLVTVKATEEDINTLLLNILDNAVKHNNKDRVCIHISTYDGAAAPIVEITDNGNGIPEKEIPLIFNKFYRSQQGTVHQNKGLGLGLYHVKKIADKYGFTISIKNNQGEGTKVIINF